MLIEKLKRGIDFTSQEQAIAEYILQNSDSFQQLNCEELGRATFTSKSTVVRLCKKLCVSGYQELKKILYLEFEEEKKTYGYSGRLKLSKDSTCSDIIAIIPDLYSEAVKEVNLYNGTNLIKRISNRMSKMTEIDFYGTGLGYTLLETASQKFNAIGVESKVYNTLNERYLLANRKKNKMMAFVLTFSGNNPLAIHEAEVLKSLGVYVIGIVGPLSEEISKSCDEIIRLSYRFMQNETEVILINHCINYIMDIFVTGMLVNDYEHIIEQEHFINRDYDKELNYCKNIK
jgi:DNA-binding MurR/RpiR family transcriptional regulator